MDGSDDRRGGSPPARADRVAAALVVVLLLASLARSIVRPRPAEPPPAAPAAPPPTPPRDTERPAPPARTGPRVRFEVSAEVAVKESGPPLALRLRSKSGAARTFDFTTRPEPTRTRFAIEVDLPIVQPDFPLRGELVGESWCIPPGLLDFEVARLDAPCSLVLARAKRLDVAAQDEAGRPLPGVRIVHESGRTLATTAADGVAKVVRPARSDREALVAMADGFAPALVEGGGAPVVLRRSSGMGRLHGVVRAADGSAVAGASIEPRWFPGGEPPGASKSAADAAARGLYRLSERTRDSPLAALAATSDADGAFEMALPFGGRLILTATHRELGRCSLTLDLAGDAGAAGRRTDAELRFARRTALTVTATLDGAPVSRCVVEVVASGRDGPTVVAAATSDAKGSALLAVPELPSLFLVLRSEITAPRVLAFDAKGEASVARAETLERGRPLRLTLAGGDGLEAAAQVVEARDSESRILLATATSDGRGAVRFARLPSARPFDLTLKALGAEAPRLAAGLVLEKLAADGEVDLGELALKRK